MSKSVKRTGLLGLTRQPLGQPVQSRVPIEVAERLLLDQPAERNTETHQETLPELLPETLPEILPVVQPEIPSISTLKPKQVSRRVAWSLKIEPGLLQELRDVAKYYDLVASDIVEEALALHLRNFPHPSKPSQR
jgi:hypothetical protein